MIAGFKSLAECLLQAAPLTDQREALYRTAISRWYYASYLAAREYVDRGAALREEGGSHERVWKAFTGDTLEQQVRQAGFGLMRRRRQADYDATTNNLEKEARSARAECHSILRQLEALTRHSSRS